MDVVVGLMRSLVHENSRKAMNQDEYNRKYDAYTEKYDELKNAYTEDLNCINRYVTCMCNYLYIDTYARFLKACESMKSAP